MVKLTIDYNRFDIVPKEPIAVDEVILDEDAVADYLMNLDTLSIKPNSIKFDWDYTEENISE